MRRKSPRTHAPPKWRWGAPPITVPNQPEGRWDGSYHLSRDDPAHPKDRKKDNRPGCEPPGQGRCEGCVGKEQNVCKHL
eukprot:scaffold86_cov338-Pavlova_lutheri.AAC.38